MLFIKDVIGSNEICCWSFYGHGKKIAEVCCTAIVYATDRKNTKVTANQKTAFLLTANHSTVFQVEFPEARIYEETLNCLLYENRTGPDQDLMQATSHRQPDTGNQLQSNHNNRQPVTGNRSQPNTGNQ